MGELDKLAKTVNDILECRIEAVLEDMSATALCELPEDEAVTMEKFLEITSDVVANASKYLAKYVLLFYMCEILNKYIFKIIIWTLEAIFLDT
jgi:dynein heavy chain